MQQLNFHMISILQKILRIQEVTFVIVLLNMVYWNINVHYVEILENEMVKS